MKARHAVLIIGAFALIGGAVGGAYGDEFVFRAFMLMLVVTAIAIAVTFGVWLFMRHAPHRNEPKQVIEIIEGEVVEESRAIALRRGRSVVRR